jgi:uncharacterized protein (DUF58 family)
MKIRPVYFVIPLVVGVVASLTGFTLVWKLFILSCLIPLVSYIWTLLILRGISAEIALLPKRSQAGNSIDSHIKLNNSARYPCLMVSVKEIGDVPGYSNQSVINIMPKKPIDISSRILFTQRGQYRLGPYQLSAGDPLGLFRTERLLGKEQNVTVFPATVELPFFDPLHYLNPGFGPGRWVSPQISTNVSSIRDYASGDSLRHIHWRTTAHSAKMMVKVYEPERSQNSVKNIWLVSDMQSNIQAGVGLNSTEEYNITLIASLARKYIEQAWPVGLISQAEKAYYFPLETGSLHLDNLYSVLAVMQARGTLPLEQMLSNEAGHFDLNSMTVVVTPSCNERLVRVLLQIKKQQGVLVVIFLDPGTFGGEKVMPNIPATLQSNGVQVYVVKSGDNLDMSLDSRKF